MTRARDLARLGNSQAITLDTNSNVGIGSTIPDAKLDVVGVVSATSFYGDGSNLSNIISGVGIKTAGGTVGTGATTLDFRGAGISTVTVAAGIATINITGGGGGSQLSISTTAPAGPTDGQQWFDSSDGNTYIWYASQNVWVVSQTYGY